MPTPKEVFDDPLAFIDFLTTESDDRFEGQHFDRKESCRADENGNISTSKISKVRDHIIETVSAFANKNRQGGVLVLGIDSSGDIVGIDHLGEQDVNSFVNFNVLLRNQRAQADFIEVQDAAGTQRKICLIYTPYTPNAICETPSKNPKCWIRQHASNIPINREMREQLERDKGIVRFELSPCCPFDVEQMDHGVFEQFKKVWSQQRGQIDRSDEEVLISEGAVVKDEARNLHFTNAGQLFFGVNPQSHLDWAYVRLLKFEGSFMDLPNRGLPVNSKEFRGSLATQIRQIRAYLKESAFFRTYTRRSETGGGFIEEPEYPHAALDEAIVNAVAHRDYANRQPIIVEAYRDGLLVKNPGALEQPDKDLPDRFSLAIIPLESKPRNSKLIEWLKITPSEQGTPFVFALAEGTNTMRREMEKLNLPAPSYQLSASQTSLLLQNNADEREALMKGQAPSESTEYSNLYPLEITEHAGSTGDLGRKNSFLKKDFLQVLKDALLSKAWYIDTSTFGRIIAHRRGVAIPLKREVDQIVRLYPAYIFEARQYWGKSYLCIDFDLQVKSVRNAAWLLSHFDSNELNGRTATVNWNGWQRGRILEVSTDFTKIQLFDFDTVVDVESDNVIPNLSKTMIDRVLEGEGIDFDLSSAIKRHSLSAAPSAARERFEKSQSVAESLHRTTFPLSISGATFYLNPQPASLTRLGIERGNFRAYTLTEPVVEFGKGNESSDIRDGVTVYGSYQDTNKAIEIVPICVPEMRDKMSELINRLKVGKYKYRGSERTFHTKFSYGTILNAPVNDALAECERVISEHPDWIGNGSLNRLFLVQTPERSFSLDDETSPYYRIKRYLLERGIPCQMVDTPTLSNPDWKDLNLALNIVAKCGVVPWVLPDAIPDADFFIGLSYTQSARKKSERLMGYANVFNHYGKWEFYSGNVRTFSFEQRAQFLAQLVRETLEKLRLSDTPSIHFHYSKRFSREERETILASARTVKPGGLYTFVWINKEHHVRLYDVRAETDGSLARGSYVVASPRQFYISTTGYNPYRKALGTPKMLEVNVYPDERDATLRAMDLRIIANHILSLTKLNWASTDSLCGEPITTKYAGDIAYLTAAFLRQGSPLELHEALEGTPWFL